MISRWEKEYFSFSDEIANQCSDCLTLLRRVLDVAYSKYFLPQVDLDHKLLGLPDTFVLFLENDTPKTARKQDNASILQIIVEYPDLPIIIISPHTMCKGQISEFILLHNEESKVISSHFPFYFLLKRAIQVFTHDSILGLLSMAYHIPVIVTGTPFYVERELGDCRKPSLASSPIERLFLATFYHLEDNRSEHSEIIVDILSFAIESIWSNLRFVRSNINKQSSPWYSLSISSSNAIHYLIFRIRKILGWHHMELPSRDAVHRLFEGCDDISFQTTLLCLIYGRMFPFLSSDAFLDEFKAIVRPETLSQVTALLKTCGKKPNAPLWKKNHQVRQLRALQRENKFYEAQELALSLILKAQDSPVVWSLLAQLHFSRFHFSTAFHLCRIALELYPQWREGRLFLSCARYALLVDQAEIALCLLIESGLNYTRNIDITSAKYKVGLDASLGRLPWQRAFALAQSRQSNNKKLAAVSSLLLAESYDDAERMLRGIRFFHKVFFLPTYNKLLTEVLLKQDKKEEAKNLLKKQRRTTEIYDQSLSFCIEYGDTKWAKEIIEKTDRQRTIQLSPQYLFTVLFGLGRLREAFSALGKSPHFHIVESYVRGKVLFTVPPKKAVNHIIVLSECFTGDEIRYSRLYPLIAQHAGAERVTFSCDPRLLALLQRSYPDLNFLATRRTTDIISAVPLKEFMQLPDPSCCRYFDNHGWEAVKKADNVISVVHAIASVLDNFETLEDLPSLRVDFEKKAFCSKLLAPHRNKRLVGLSWRGSGTASSKIWANFQLADLEELFGMADTLFVNCMYDRYTYEEQEYISTRLSGKLFSLPEIDTKNDIDMTAALFSCLDAVVSTPTYTCELAGVLGVPTILIGKSWLPAFFSSQGKEYIAFLGKKSRYVCVRPTDVDRISTEVTSILQNIAYGVPHVS